MNARSQLSRKIASFELLNSKGRLDIMDAEELKKEYDSLKLYYLEQ